MATCDCPCHSSTPDSTGCPDCIERHDAEPTASAPKSPDIDAADGAACRPERRAPIDELRALPRPEKMILATKADRPTRALLMRDVDPQVLFYLCKNPRITLDEVTEIAKLGTINGSVADLIAMSAQWVQSEQVRLNLVQNPKTPTPTALKLLGGLHIKHLQVMAKSWNIKPQIKQAALKLVIERVR